jgi:hypothetical protein
MLTFSNRNKQKENTLECRQHRIDKVVVKAEFVIYDAISDITLDGILPELTFVKKFNIADVIVVPLFFKFPVNATTSEFEPN